MPQFVVLLNESKSDIKVCVKKILVITKTSQESRKAALRKSHRFVGVILQLMSLLILSQSEFLSFVTILLIEIF